MLDPSAVSPDGDLVEAEVERLIIRRHRHSPEVAAVVGADWAERQEPNNVLVSANAIENAIAEELEHTWLHPSAGSSPYAGWKERTPLPVDAGQGVPQQSRRTAVDRGRADQAARSG